jgi:hypothetical protein
VTVITVLPRKIVSVVLIISVSSSASSVTAALSSEGDVFCVVVVAEGLSDFFSGGVVVAGDSSTKTSTGS